MSIWSQLAGLAGRAFEVGEEPARAISARGTEDTRSREVAEPLCGPDPNDIEFTAAIVGLGAKLAKADGLVTIDEVAAFSRVFRAAPGDEAAMRRVFDIARQTVVGYENYARRIAKRYRDRPCLLEGVLDGLFQIAAADGAVTSDELDYLKSVADSFGFNEDQFRRIKATHLGAEPDDPYSILGIPHAATFEEVRTAYRQLMRENHPDKSSTLKSAPREYEHVAHEKAAAITTAYARIRAERGFLTRAD